MNHTNDGFLNSILNDEELWSEAVNEGQLKYLFIYRKHLHRNTNLTTV
jgi:hypothetical protein